MKFKNEFEIQDYINHCWQYYCNAKMAQAMLCEFETSNDMLEIQMYENMAYGAGGIVYNPLEKKLCDYKSLIGDVTFIMPYVLDEAINIYSLMTRLSRQDLNHPEVFKLIAVGTFLCDVYCELYSDYGEKIEEYFEEDYFSREAYAIPEVLDRLLKCANINTNVESWCIKFINEYEG